VVQHPREAKEVIGFVPDQPELYDKLSGREFLQFVADIRGIVGRAQQASIDELSEILELRDFLDQLTENYSHGMKQRIAVAAALVHRPKLLVLDEPMVGLDPRMMRIVKEQLRVRAKQGMSVFISTHTLAMAEEIADRIGVIDHGCLQFVGTKDELRSKLADHEASLENLYLKLTEAAEVAPEPAPIHLHRPA
ncbi:MAG: ABC transporter ATP-binding protein, partial [Planctomycetota bacterium]